MSYWDSKSVLVTGGSSGFGLVLARALLDAGARVTAVARDSARLESAFAEHAAGDQVERCAADVTSDRQSSNAVERAVARFGQLDAVFACAGRSHRGKVEQLTGAVARELWEVNFLGALHVVHAALPHLERSRGHVVLIGSLASKTASPFLGAYPTSKFPLTAYAQQLRLEWLPRGVHTLLVCPGPIARPDSGKRYDALAADLPESARRPGGGAKLRGIDPLVLAARVLKATERRKRELVVPGRARILFALQQLSPRWGDWLVRKMTR